mgnify:CR=1 FL=1
MIGEANARTAHAFWGTWRINAEKNLPPFPHLHAQESSHMKEVGSESRPRPFSRAHRIHPRARKVCKGSSCLSAYASEHEAIQSSTRLHHAVRLLRRPEEMQRM